MSIRTRRYRGLWVLVLLVLAAAMVSRGIARQTTAFEQLDLLVDVRHEIVKEYVEEPDQEQMTQSAVRAMIGALKDPYTIYLAPDELKAFDNQVRGTFSGIGAEVDIHDNRLRIITPLEGSPAWKAGVMAGDIVLDIDGVTTEGMKINEAVRKLQGPEGTQVTIRVRHANGDENQITITRAQINVRTVKGVRLDAQQRWDYLLDHANRIGYIRVTQFTDSTAPDMADALKQLKALNVRGLILDLRFNPGGLLESAEQISDMFLAGGKRIVSVRGRVIPERVTMSTQDAILPDTPLVVLANEGSASAAEIVTGALFDNERACFVGTRTFGKGSVQQVRMLESGQGAIKITNAYYYLPSGRNIHRRTDKDVWGVDPADGFYVPMDTEQVRAMLKVRNETDARPPLTQPATQPASTPAVTPESIEKDLADPQLAAGFKALVGYLADKNWPKVGLSNAQALAVESRRALLTRQREQIQERLDAIDTELDRLDNNAATQPATAPATAPAIPPDAKP